MAGGANQLFRIHRPNVWLVAGCAASVAFLHERVVHELPVAICAVVRSKHLGVGVGLVAGRTRQLALQLMSKKAKDKLARIVVNVAFLAKLNRPGTSGQKSLFATKIVAGRAVLLVQAMG